MRRLGLDVGTNSIGWCLIEDDARIVDIGVRIFSEGRDPKSGASATVDHRAARAMRRRRDRYLGRRSAFLKALKLNGLMQEDASEAKLLADLDPNIGLRIHSRTADSCHPAHRLEILTRRGKCPRSIFR